MEEKFEKAQHFLHRNKMAGLYLLHFAIPWSFKPIYTEIYTKIRICKLQIFVSLFIYWETAFKLISGHP